MINYKGRFATLVDVQDQTPIENVEACYISDGYHTFQELYEFRMILTASLFNEWAGAGLYDCHKSKRHSDGELCFGSDEWFIVMARLPTGQISFHYPLKDWNRFHIPEKEKADTFDGHTSLDVMMRLSKFIENYQYFNPS